MVNPRNPHTAMGAALQAANQLLIGSNAENDPGPPWMQGARSIIIIRRAVEQYMGSSFPVSAVLEITVRLTQVPDGAQALTADENKVVHVALGQEIDAALNEGTVLQVGGGAPQHRVILFARTLPDKNHYITADPSTDYIKAAYLKKIFRDLNHVWAARGAANELVYPQLPGAAAEFILSRPLDYQSVQ